MTKPKRTDATESMTADAALQKLQEYGERFMAMFDDDGRKTSKASPSGRRCTQSTPHGKAAAAVDGTQGEGGRSTGKGAQKRRQDVTPAASAKKQRQDHQQQQRQQQTAGGSRKGSAAPEPVGSPPSSSGAKGKRRPTSSGDEIDAIMRAGKKGKQGQPKGGSRAGPAGEAGKASQAAAAAAVQSAAMAEALRRERKLFMSHKASKVHEVVQARPVALAAAAAARSEEDAGLTQEEFQKLQLEVEKFAAGSLDKKAAKQYKARMLARIGSKGDTAPRTAASIGKGVAKMATKRQARALEEAIETGMVQRKGLGKKKRALAAKNRDRGLMEAGPSFKNGILRVKPMKKTRAESGKLRLPKGVL